jgi:hypothetical protein
MLIKKKKKKKRLRYPQILKVQSSTCTQNSLILPFAMLLDDILNANPTNAMVTPAQELNPRIPQPSQTQTVYHLSTAVPPTVHPDIPPIHSSSQPHRDVNSPSGNPPSSYH